ncbi:MAG: MotA/TolQ/ExbB proton channel family protein [Verrucomicrobiota bacterium JB022]|nr:MotA/TolQ/ExbB proton channel family protein [Verrucomicrobiota bacterium JB022]
MKLFEQVWGIWQSGGWVMIALGGLSLAIYTQAYQLLIFTWRCRLQGEPESDWPLWIQYLRTAPPGLTRQIIEYARGLDPSHADGIRHRFDEIRDDIVGVVDRRVRYIETMITTAPLLGLLGTVLGMLSTFLGLATSGGGESMETVASGIRVALITTATGLTIALPGLFLSMLIRRQRQQLEAGIAQLESITLSTFHRQGLPHQNGHESRIPVGNAFSPPPRR